VTIKKNGLLFENNIFLTTKSLLNENSGLPEINAKIIRNREHKIRNVPLKNVAKLRKTPNPTTMNIRIPPQVQGFARIAH
jgi:hypothetical protein